jgi:mono/diheme cytochrome c family protein
MSTVFFQTPHVIASITGNGAWWLLTIILGAIFLYGTASEWHRLVYEDAGSRRPQRGADAYRTYCSSCHGADGREGGPKNLQRLRYELPGPAQ